MIESLEQLSEDIPIHFLYGSRESCLNELVKKLKDDKYVVNRIGVSHDYTPYSKVSEEKLERFCKKSKIKLLINWDTHTLMDLRNICSTKKELHYRFTSFYNDVLTHTQKIKPCGKLNKRVKFMSSIMGINKYSKTLFNIKNNLLNERISPLRIKGGRKEGLDALKVAKNSLNNYNETRDIMSVKTSMLSAYHKFGCISVKETFDTMRNNREFIRQVIWRD